MVRRGLRRLDQLLDVVLHDGGRALRRIVVVEPLPLASPPVPSAPRHVATETLPLWKMLSTSMFLCAANSAHLLFASASPLLWPCMLHVPVQLVSPPQVALLWRLYEPLKLLTASAQDAAAVVACGI